MGKDQELLEAARNGNVAVVEKILGQRARRSGPLASLRRGPGANVQDSSGYSALHHAALNGHKEVVKLLLQYEASTNIVDAKGSSPLHLAAWSGNSEIVRLILSQGPSVPNVNLTTKDNETALHCAAQYGHTEVVAQLLQYGCDPSIRNSRGESALDLAAQYGRLETVELLVRTHPELIESLRNSSSSLIFPHTPLHLASRNGHRACVEVLLAAGVDVNTRTSAGTAMHEAALCGKMEVVRTLLDRGVDLAIKDSRQNTVLDLLGQFPAHVTQDITAVIKRHRSSSGMESDADSEHLPPIPVQGNDSLGSPYENVRPGHDLSPVEGSSPTHWRIYHKPRDDDRRVSGNSAMSLGSDSGLYQTPPVPRALAEGCGSAGGYTSEDQLSMTLPGSGYYGGRESDQLSVSSSSSMGGPSPRERRCLTGDPSSGGIYLPMAPLSSSLQSPASSSKVSNGGVPSPLQPTPPKKPPRRNLSVSPTHLQSQMSLSADCHVGPSNYEYLFLARSGARSHIDLDQIQTRREQLRHVTRSVDQYVDMSKSRFEPQFQQQESPRRSDGAEHPEPVAITSVYENRPMRMTNPRRKLRRHAYERSAYENYEMDSSPGADKSPCSESGIATATERTYVSNAFLTLKSSQESLLDDRRDEQQQQQAEAQDKRLKRIQMLLPTSPTHYAQPPTPDHPPPSAMQAEKSIHERIRPLSQVYKRRSRDMETETDEDLLLLQFPASAPASAQGAASAGSLDASSGSLSSVSLSDKSASGPDNNVEEYFGDVPFAGRRRHVRRPSRSRHCRQSSGPGAAVAATSATVAATAAGRRRALEPPPSPSPPPLRSAPLAAATSVAMEPESEEELYRCSRCRGERLCSCSHLGLVPPDDDDDRQCRCEERGCDWEEEEDAMTGTSRSSTRQRHRRHACEDAARTTTTTYTWRRRAEGEDCGCAADRDVLRRRPPEGAGGEGASGLPRPSTPRSRILPPYLATLLILSYSLVGVADACSSRSTPKPRPPTPTPRPNITFHMYACPPDYAEWYCLNGATCFTVKIVESLLYNCLCANGYIGQRCEFKDLDGSYLPSRQRVMLETASIAGAVTIAVFLAVITFISVYVQCKRRQKELRTSTDVDAVDGMGRDPELRPFCSRSRSLMHFMAKNPNSSVITQSIEKTRMPSWSHPAESSTRMTSVNETKRPPSQ